MHHDNDRSSIMAGPYSWVWDGRFGNRNDRFNTVEICNSAAVAKYHSGDRLSITLLRLQPVFNPFGQAHQAHCGRGKLRPILRAVDQLGSERLLKRIQSSPRSGSGEAQQPTGLEQASPAIDRQQDGQIIP
jgi:hypothetical protein